MPDEPPTKPPRSLTRADVAAVLRNYPDPVKAVNHRSWTAPLSKVAPNAQSAAVPLNGPGVKARTEQAVTRRGVDPVALARTQESLSWGAACPSPTPLTRVSLASKTHAGEVCLIGKSA